MPTTMMAPSNKLNSGQWPLISTCIVASGSLNGMVSSNMLLERFPLNSQRPKSGPVANKLSTLNCDNLRKISKRCDRHHPNSFCADWPVCAVCSEVERCVLFIASTPCLATQVWFLRCVDKCRGQQIYPMQYGLVILLSLLVL